MILRRRAQNLREQNWTAIGIEFVLLVLGVFLGIQVANWNEQRLDQQLAQRYLADIASDIRSDLNELARVQDSALDRMAASAHVLREAGVAVSSHDVRVSDTEVDDVFAQADFISIPSPPPLSTSERSHLWEAVTVTYAFDLNRGGFDALVGSGKLDLISDPDVMRLLREYYYLVNVLDRTQQRTSLPLRNIVLELGMTHGLSPGLQMDETALVAKVKATPPLAAGVGSSRHFAGLIYLISELQQQKGEELLHLLKAKAAS
jgi:hypothetical protein